LVPTDNKGISWMHLEIALISQIGKMLESDHSKKPGSSADQTSPSLSILDLEYR